MSSVQDYLEKIEQGDSTAMNKLAQHYKEEKQFDKAIMYWLMAIDHGNTSAMNNIAYYYLNDSKTYTYSLEEFQEKKKNEDLGISYYKMAIELENSTAMYNLALHYEEQREYLLAVEYYKMAIELEDSDAMFNLADLYEKKLLNYEQAVIYYEMASKAGNSNAMNALGLYYDKKTHQYDWAITYYQKAIELENHDAMYNLAYLYDTNKNPMYVNKGVAYEYLLMSVKHENRKAVKYLCDMESVSFYNKYSIIKKYCPEQVQILLEKCVEFQQLENKINVFESLNNVHACAVCNQNDVLNIIYNCGHEVCVDCLVKTNGKCYNGCKSDYDPYDSDEN